MKRRHSSLHYCSRCRMTTRHTEAESTSTCVRCGTVKRVTRIIRDKSESTLQVQEAWN